MRAISTGLIITMLALTANDAFAKDLSLDSSAEAARGANADAAQAATGEAAAWREVAAATPLGSKVKVQTVYGKRFNGVLMRVDAGGLLVKRNTRRPEPAITVPFDDISKLERDTGNGANVGKAIAIGLATGAGVILGLFIMALQFD